MFMIVGNNFKTAMSVTLWPQNPQKNLLLDDQKVSNFVEIAAKNYTFGPFNQERHVKVFEGDKSVS